MQSLPPPTTLKIPSLSSNPSPSLQFPTFSTNRLIRQINDGRLRTAISTLEHMVQHGTHPDLQTYSLFLKRCIRTRSFDLGRLVHENLTQSDLQLDSVTLNSLISLYSKSGQWEKAKSIFERMGNSRDLISWSAMVSCFANNKMGFEALHTFLDMIQNGYYPNEYCFSAAIRACSTVEFASVGDSIFGYVIKTGYFASDVCVGCGLIDMFVKGRGDLVSAFEVFEKMPERNAVTWTLMITRFMQFGYAGEAIDVFLDMILSGYEPDRFTLSAVISASAKLELLSLGQQLHSQAIKHGLTLDRCVGCCLINMYAKCSVDGSMSESRKIFDQILDHNVISWTAMITGYVQKGGYDKEALDLFRGMILTHVLPNHFTFSSTLKACANLADLRIGEQVFTHAVKLGFSIVNCVANSLISMYARSGKIDDARKAFDILFEKNLISYNTVIDAYSKNLNSEEAFELFNEIEDQGMGASAFTFASLLSGAASIGTIGKGEQIHARVIKSGLKSNQSICNALISMYSKCGDIDSAFQVFEDMDDRNVISWTSIITGFAKHGFATKALELFHKMLEAGIRPNEVSYIAVLSACSHVGLVNEGWKHFKSMYAEHGVTPRMEHYACMVDILGRSGSLSEAIQFINSMPFKADALVWRTFLGACRVHDNLELGKHAAKMIIEQEPQDPAAYILLSNLYASTSQWEEVASIRKVMKQKNLIKEAGCSWVEIENKVHKFYVGDTSHSKAEEIYDELEHLSLKIKKLGYVPNMDFVLHDVEEEKKEKYLFQHSERIAVAFGLISISKSKPIRVFKNLRICGDCHSAIKYISLATGREIIVRDANRFHHIKDGRCSCNEYW
ncbi:pentatricopeptide repeat-containing protein At3g49170, chloroplastic [Cucurbita pepo subsp. pepo]|uniref:pentatricopeptide repeat-containing protein At3g49170, chloroplastic n=1 Tax=Cucurbita pepo subsp. pepo TaxID=3664 RepID=UPI000C9D7ABB|nr:pentatricopeptide repeat-containing protein At3g49170, chloroplastic [Cucurbita pepo subsp. pepo]